MKVERRPILELPLARRAAQLGPPVHRDGGDAISFDSGYAFPGILPDLTVAAERALNQYRSESLQYGTPFGVPELREWIASYMRDNGADVPVEEVLVVNGAKRGIELICRLLTDEGDAVAVTGPMYFTAIPIMRSFGLEFIEVGRDDEGFDVGALAEALAQRGRAGKRPPKFIYDVTDFHNPTGVTTSRRRREELIDLATRRRIPIVEDSPYRKLRFEGESLPSLKSLDREGLVFEVGTFSKILAPGLRIGWVSAPHEFLSRMARLKSDGGSCPLTQRTIIEFLKDGGIAPHLERARAAYRSHRDAMVAALHHELPDVTFSIPQGGYYLWLRFPEGTDTSILAERAYDEGVSPIAGAVFYPTADAPHPKNYMRLAYSHAAPDEIDRGVKLLATAYRSM
jgi:2-aminoadipate transaminase